MISSVYLRLLIFLLAILIPAYDSSSPAFLIMYSEYKLNKQGDNIQPCHTLFPILNQSVVPCPVLIAASWPAYRVSQETGKAIWYSHLFKNFPQFVVLHTVKSFSILKYIVSMGFSRQEYWSELSFSSPVNRVRSELFPMAHLSWVALHGLAHSFIQVCKTLTTTMLWSMKR